MPGMCGHWHGTCPPDCPGEGPIREPKSKTKKFTVLFSHDLPLRRGVAQFLCSLELAETAEEAADRCIRSVGGYATIIAVLEGHRVPVLQERCMTWDNQSQYDSKAISVPKYTRKVSNPALETPKRTRKATKKRSLRNGAMGVMGYCADASKEREAIKRKS